MAVDILPERKANEMKCASCEKEIDDRMSIRLTYFFKGIEDYSESVCSVDCLLKRAEWTVEASRKTAEFAARINHGIITGQT